MQHMCVTFFGNSTLKNTFHLIYVMYKPIGTSFIKVTSVFWSSCAPVLTSKPLCQAKVGPIIGGSVTSWHRLCVQKQLFKRGLTTVCLVTHSIIALCESMCRSFRWHIFENIWQWEKRMIEFSLFTKVVYTFIMVVLPFLPSILCCVVTAKAVIVVQEKRMVTECDNQTPHHLLTCCVIMRMCVPVWVCMCLNDMFSLSLPPEGSFSGRYTFALTGVLICKWGQDKCTCHSHSHGIPSSYTGGQEVRNGKVMMVNNKTQVK